MLTWWKENQEVHVVADKAKCDLPDPNMENTLANWNCDRVEVMENKNKKSFVQIWSMSHLLMSEYSRR